MKKLLGIVVLGLLLSVNTYADDDIRDLQLNGMSLGDSALEYFDEKEIKKNIKNWYKNKDIIGVSIKANDQDFDRINIHYWANDKSYTLIAIGGIKFYKNDITNCRAQMKEEVKTIADSFKGLRKKTYNKLHSGDKTKKSKTYNTEFKYKSGDLIKISCFDWSKKMKYWDNFRMSLLAAEFNDWLDKAYK